ncbi:DoxX family protein [Flavobacterium plurextorum]|uniref:DoxX family protein n=1 Tax=Flavobacterium TaxID=237 RepID=UPI00214D301E|nr:MULTISPECIES: DoxX family protein [Flavobacterium]UUW08273.1 DoxX family protein [Flavobacterium plurextorum]
MKLNVNFKNIIVEVICLLFVLLFVYAGASKLFDFEHFKIELGQSPLLSAFADWFAVLVPAAEALICLLLIVPRYRLVGLYSAYALMMMFTVYIYMILNFTAFVPCSCGGVLEKLDWKSHLIFNMIFVCLGIIGIFLYSKSRKFKGNFVRTRMVLKMISAITIMGTASVTILFLLSENIVHFHNKLTRRFPHSPVTQTSSLDLKLNSFYFAGADSSKVYLGNITAPLMVTTIDTQLIKSHSAMIDLNDKDLPFRGVKINVRSPYFFVSDGTVPCIFRGRTNNWKASLVHRSGEYFGNALALDSTAIAVETYSKKNGDRVLGVINIGNPPRTILNPEILQKQFDGVFDTEGQLLYSEGIDRIIYLYAYRNQFTIADKNLKITSRGTTIDTITRAKLSITKDSKHQQRQFSSPPQFVNKNSSVYKNLLFVKSAIPGRYEDDRMWKRSSIIDVYDLPAKSYLLSFTIQNIEGSKMKSFIVYNDRLYTLMGNQIICYKIDSQITSKYTNNTYRQSIGQIAGQ